MHPQASQLLSLDPIPTLIHRTCAELGAEFDVKRPFRLSRAPGRLDVMGGIADYTGSLVCELPLDRAVSVVLQERADRELQIFSFNLFDDHKPFTFRIPIDALTAHPVEKLRAEFNTPDRRWAAYVAGCIIALHRFCGIRLQHGLNIAIYSTVPIGAGVSSSAALEIATMMNLLAHVESHRGAVQRSGEGEAPAAPSSCDPARQEARPPNNIEPMQVAEWCQWVENHIAGAPCGIMDQATSCAGEQDSLMRLVCQPHSLNGALKLPDGVRVVGINSNVKHNIGGGKYGITRCAAFMGHAMILAKMSQMGTAAGKELIRDPMNGYLANLDLNDYKRYFREYLPEFMSGQEFLDKFGKTIDTATVVDPTITYPVQHAADHHVFEASRVRNFCLHIEDAARAGRDTKDGGLSLDKAGHLMYASHMSYTMDAMLGADECDLLVDLVRKEERAGLYGAKITGGGSGGTVAVLCNISDRADEAIARILSEYQSRTGKIPEAFTGSSPGAWAVGTALLKATG